MNVCNGLALGLSDLRREVVPVKPRPKALRAGLRQSGTYLLLLSVFLFVGLGGLGAAETCGLEVSRLTSRFLHLTSPMAWTSITQAGVIHPSHERAVNHISDPQLRTALVEFAKSGIFVFEMENFIDHWLKPAVEGYAPSSFGVIEYSSTGDYFLKRAVRRFLVESQSVSIDVLRSLSWTQVLKLIQSRLHAHEPVITVSVIVDRRSDQIWTIRNFEHALGASSTMLDPDTRIANLLRSASSFSAEQTWQSSFPAEFIVPDELRLPDEVQSLGYISRDEILYMYDGASTKMNYTAARVVFNRFR